MHEHDKSHLFDKYSLAVKRNLHPVECLKTQNGWTRTQPSLRKLGQ